MVEETWRPVATPGFDSFYEVSSAGRVRRSQTGRVLVLGRHPKGYQSVVFSASGQRTTALVHRLVLEAFVGPCPEGCECRHLDGDRTNNELRNLAWGTFGENEADKVLHGTVQLGGANGRAALSEGQVREILARHAAGEGQRTLASAFGISQPQVSKIVTGKQWGHLERPIRPW